MVQTRSQSFAETVFGQISGLPDQNAKLKKCYGGLCLKFPALVLANGLIQTVAFIESKAAEPGARDAKPAEAARRLFLEHVWQTVRPQQPPADSLYGFLRHERCDCSIYMNMTRRCLQAGQWYKRLAESLLGAEPTDDAGVADA
jgi:CRISPR-associated protein Cmr5